MQAVAPTLGTASSFVVLGATAVTNTGPTLVTGDLGVSPGTAVTGFPPGIVVGTVHSADAVALQAQTDVTTAYNNLAGQACDVILTGQNLGGLTLTPGVYCFSSSSFLTGILTLNALGDPNAVFIFQIGSTLITAPNASVNMINTSGAVNACNVYWQVGSSATLDTNTNFIGNILALTSITLNTGADVVGRTLARNGAVTMDSSTVSGNCAVAVATSTATRTNTPVGPGPTSTATLVAGVTPSNTPIIVDTPIGAGTPTGTTIPSTPTTPGAPIATNTPTPNGTPGGVNTPGVIDTPGPGTPQVNLTPTPTGTRKGPSVITLKAFTASDQNGSTWVRWETGSEIDTFGFALYRGETPDRSTATQITTAVIASTSTNTSGTAYQFADLTAIPGQIYYYWLQEIETTGIRNEHGPVRTNAAAIAASSPLRLFMPVLLPR